MTDEGIEVTQYTLSNRSGIRLQVLDYGCTLTSVMIPDRHGTPGEIVLGYDGLEGYLRSPHYMGCIIGRCAGRIPHGDLIVDGTHSDLPVNQPPHHLHGGHNGLDKRIWQVRTFEADTGVGIDFHYRSPDGEEGYPGDLDLYVRYFLTHQHALLLHYKATANRTTAVNLTQHSYFNLSGGHDHILKHALQVSGDHYLPVESTLVPTGEIQAVHNTPFDFRSPQILGVSLLQDDPQLRIAGGIDHYWVLPEMAGEMRHAASLLDPVSGRCMDVHTTADGIHIYSANGLEGPARGGRRYTPYAGICFETQHFPGGGQYAGFPFRVIRPGEVYDVQTLITFGTR